MRGWLWSCRSSATASPTIRTHSSSRLPVSPAAGAAATLFPHRYQRATTHLATTCQLHSRLCGHRTAMWQDRLAMWFPRKMVTSSKLDEPSMQARKSGHTAHHCGGVARTPCRGHTAPLRTPPPWTRIQAWPRTFRCGPALSKTYLGYRRTVSALQVIVRRWLSGLDLVSVATRCLLEAYGCWHACYSDSEANRGCNLRKY